MFYVIETEALDKILTQAEVLTNSAAQLPIVAGVTLICGIIMFGVVTSIAIYAGMSRGLKSAGMNQLITGMEDLSNSLRGVVNNVESVKTESKDNNEKLQKKNGRSNEETRKQLRTNNRKN